MKRLLIASMVLALAVPAFAQSQEVACSHVSGLLMQSE
jgi:hypothetical protein